MFRIERCDLGYGSSSKDPCISCRSWLMYEGFEVSQKTYQARIRYAFQRNDRCHAQINKKDNNKNQAARLSGGPSRAVDSRESLPTASA